MMTKFIVLFSFYKYNYVTVNVLLEEKCEKHVYIYNDFKENALKLLGKY